MDSILIGYFVILRRNVQSDLMDSCDDYSGMWVEDTASAFTCKNCHDIRPLAGIRTRLLHSAHQMRYYQGV
jgi:hypothetical protein